MAKYNDSIYMRMNANNVTEVRKRIIKRFCEDKADFTVFIPVPEDKADRNTYRMDGGKGKAVGNLVGYGEMYCPDEMIWLTEKRIGKGYVHHRYVMNKDGTLGRRIR